MTDTRLDHSTARIWIAGGGTGGHLYPGLALAQALQELAPRCTITFIGTRHGLDRELVPQYGFRLIELPIGRGSPLQWRQPQNSLRFLQALWQCRQIGKAERPDVIVSLGGFAASVPGLWGAWSGIPLILLEQNVLPGRVTRLLSRWAQEIHVQFSGAASHLPRCPHIFSSGSPARSAIIQLTNASIEGTRLLIMGGSQGARRLNELVRDAAPDLIQAGIPLTHITGTRDYEHVAPAYTDFDEQAVRCLPYIEEVEDVLRTTRLALVRAGASTINDLQLAGRPAILVPYPYARDDHQTHNAADLVETGAALCWQESDLTASQLAERIITLWNDPDRLERMHVAMKKAAHPEAASTIARAVLNAAARHAEQP